MSGARQQRGSETQWSDDAAFDAGRRPDVHAGTQASFVEIAPPSDERVTVRVPALFSVCVRVTLLGAITAFAYRGSLNTLVREQGGRLFVLYAVLVPALAILIAVCRVPSTESTINIHDRSLDYIIGAALLAAALVMLCVLPVTMSIFFWMWRLDLLSYPLFVAGAVTILFGVRTLWRQRLPIFFLVLIWPLPYALLTASDSRDLLATLDASIVEPVRPLQDTSVFLGTNGLLAFAAVAIAAALIFRGAVLAKAVWIGTGLVLSWILDVAQGLLLGVLAPSPVGSPVSVGGDQLLKVVPVVLALAAMLSVSRRFGLRWGTSWRGHRSTSPGPIRWAPLGLVVVTSVGLLAGISDAGLLRYAPVANSFGASRIPADTMTHVDLPGWSLTHTEQHRWAAVYLDKTATWTRYTYQQTGRPGSGSNSGGGSLTADVISTTDLGLLSTYGIEESYRLKERPLLTAASVDLGSGVVGRVASYALDSQGSSWTGLYWQWPVSAPTGNRYERIVISARESLGPYVSARAASADRLLSAELTVINHLSRSQPSTGDSQISRLLEFMVWAGHQLVMTAVSRAEAGASN